MTFDYDERHIEIVSLRADWKGYGGYAMCSDHASRLRPPVGWALTDARDVAMTLFPLASVPRSAEVVAAPSSDVA